ASPMNMISASGLPTPKTVWVRERTRCAHFVQPQTRSRTDARLCALCDLGRSSCCPEIDACASGTGEGAIEYADRNRASAFLEARGARSVASRMFSSSAMTNWRAGWIISGDHAKSGGELQFFCDEKSFGFRLT